MKISLVNLKNFVYDCYACLHVSGPMSYGAQVRKPQVDIRSPGTDVMDYC